MKKGWNMVLAWLGLWLTAVGMYLGIVNIFEDRITRSPVYLWFGVLCLLFTVICLNKRRVVVAAGTVICAVCCGSYVWLHYEKLQNDWKMILWFANKRYIKYTGNPMMEIERIQGAHIMGNMLLFLACAVIVYLVALLVVRKGIFGLAWVPTGEVVSVGLLFGKAPNILAVTLLVLGYGVMALLCTVKVHRAKGKKRILKEKHRQDSVGHRVAVLSCLCILALCTTTAYFVTTRIQSDVMVYAPAFQEQQKKIEKYITKKLTATVMWIKSALGTDDNGRLSNESPKYRNKTVMKVQVDFKPNTAIYLRGFTGSYYTNGQWKSEDSDFDSQYKGKEVDLWENAYLEMDRSRTFMQQDDDTSLGRLRQSTGRLGTQYRQSLENADTAGQSLTKMQSKYLAEIRQGLENSLHHGEMTIQYEKGFQSGKIAYMPYFFDIYHNHLMSAVQVDQDLGFQKKENSYSMGFYLASQNKLKSYIDWMENGGGELFQEELSDSETEVFSAEDAQFDETGWSDIPLASQYYLYALSRYGLNNAGGSKLFEKLLHSRYGEDVADYEFKDNISGVIGIVRDLLWENTSYSTDLDPVPAGEDYAEYFYFVQKKGFCEHYATTATILLRELNVPARYVSGYRIEPDAFRLDEDGKYTAEVLDSDAHAWTETLQEYAGWTPWEVTPGDSQETDEAEGLKATLKPARDIQQNIEQQSETQIPTDKPEREATFTPMPTATPTQTPTSTATPEKQTASNDTDQKGETTGTLNIPLLLGLGGALLLIGGMAAQRRYRYKFHYRLLQACQESGREGAALCVRWVVRTMRLSGYRLPRNADLQDFLSALRGNFASALPEDEWTEYERLLKKAAYSKEGVDASEQSDCCQYSSRVNAYLWTTCKWFGKLRLLLWGRK